MGGRAMLLTRHAGMQSWQDRHNHYQNEHGMDQSNDPSPPPSGGSQLLKHENVNQGKYPSAQKVDAQAISPGPVPIRSEDGPEHVRQIHACKPQPLRQCADGGQDDGSRKTPDKPTAPVHHWGLPTSEPV